MGSRGPRKPRSSNSNKGKRQGKEEDFQQVARLVDSLSSILPILKRRLVTAVVIGTNGSGVIPATNICTSATVSGYPDFASFAGVYGLYRVRAFKISLFPVLKVNTTAANAPAFVVFAPFRGGVQPSTINQMIESPDAKYMSGFDKGSAAVAYKGDIDAHLWTATNAAIPTDQAFGIVCVGSSTPATSSTNTWYCLIEAVVEFRVTG